MKRKQYLLLILTFLLAFLFLLNPRLVLAGSPSFTRLGSVIDSETINNSNFGLPFRTGDINGDGYPDLVIPAPGYSGYKGRLYVFFGGSSLDTTADIIINGKAAGDYFPSRDTYGFAVRDLDNDGYDDIVVGGHLNDDSGVNAGIGYIFFGSATLSGTLVASSADVSFAGNTTTKKGLGTASAVGDFNGDSHLDIAYSAYAANSSAGAVYIYYGNGTKSFDTTEDVTLTVSGSTFLGLDGIASGDVNGDGYDDLIVGEDEYTQSEVYIFYGGASMDATYDVKFNGETTSDDLTRGAVDIKDINNDGFNDVCLGAYLNGSAASNAGRAYCFFGSAGFSGTKGVGSADLIFNGAAANDNLGRSLFLYDVNNDGNRDLIVGVYQVEGSSNGYVNIYLGNGTTSFDTTADITITAASIGESANLFGNYVRAGDLDNDDWPDLFITSTKGGNGTGTTGRVHIFEINHGSPSLAINGVGNTNDATPDITGTATESGVNLAGVQWSTGSSASGAWNECTATDGAFNSAAEGLPVIFTALI